MNAPGLGIWDDIVLGANKLLRGSGDLRPNGLLFTPGLWTRGNLYGWEAKLAGHLGKAGLAAETAGAVVHTGSHLGRTLVGAAKLPFAGLPLTMGFELLTAGMAPRHHFASTFGAGMLINTVGMSTGYLLAGMPGLLLAGFLIPREPIERGLQTAVEFGRRAHHLEMGGDFHDSMPAMTMRQQAAQEMAGSLVNARMHLGREGALYHS